MVERVTLDRGLIVASHGRHFVVETPEGQRLICHPRGKKSDAVVGDRVLWLASRDEGTIERVEERRNLLYRQDELRSKSFASNLDQVLVLLAAQPDFSENQLARALIAAEAQQIAPLIALNKSDLGDAFAQAWNRLRPYARMGYTVLPLALKPRAQTGPAAGAPPAWSAEQLLAHLTDKTTLVLGPSGAGKSTLINRLVPGAAAQTAEISQALNSGKHTTTSTTWYWIGQDHATALIDSPGFQEFGLHHIAPASLALYMPDIRAQAAQCRFYNCTHLHEPGCGVIQAVGEHPDAGAISPARYRIYAALFEELSRPRY